MMCRRNRLRFYKHPSPTSAPPNRPPMGRRLHGGGFEKLFVSFVVLVAVYDTRSLAGRGVQAAASSSSDVDISLSLSLSVCLFLCVSVWQPTLILSLWIDPPLPVVLSSIRSHVVVHMLLSQHASRFSPCLSVAPSVSHSLAGMCSPSS